MEEQTTQKRSKVTKGGVAMVPWFWLLNYRYAFGIKLASAGCENLRCHPFSQAVLRNGPRATAWWLQTTLY